MLTTCARDRTFSHFEARARSISARMASLVRRVTLTLPVLLRTRGRFPLFVAVAVLALLVRGRGVGVSSPLTALKFLRIKARALEGGRGRRQNSGAPRIGA